MPFTLTQKKDIPYAKQTAFNYCGPACALMVLSYLGQLSAETEGDQQKHQDALFDLADKINNPNDPLKKADSQVVEEWEGWATTPQEMVNMLHTTPQGTGNILQVDFGRANLWANHFGNANDTDQNRGNFLAALRAITKDETNKPPAIVPVHDWSHWVVLSQYAENTTSDGKVFKSFVGKDPISENIKLEKADGSFSYQGTLNIADNPLNFEREANFLLVKETTDQNNAIFRLMANFPPAAPINLPPNPIPIEAAPQIAQQRLKEFGLMTPCLAGRHLNGAVPGTPFRVKRLDRSNGKRDYYLIGMQSTNSQENRLLVRLDILTGSYLDSFGIAPTKYLLNTTKQDADLVEQVKKQIAFYQRSTKTKQRWLEALQQTLTNPAATLVWRPCEESPSAFYPFYVVKENNKTLFYVRIDGQVFFDPLHPIPRPLP